jgi:hypothetical protein
MRSDGVTRIEAMATKTIPAPTAENTLAELADDPLVQAAAERARRH